MEGSISIRRPTEIPDEPHGSWLNIAENELSVLTTQCLSRRLGTMEDLQREIAAWERSRNSEGVRVSWRFTVDRAREKLRRVYPRTQP